MHTESHTETDEMILRARLAPHRSLTRTGFMALMAVSVVSGLISIALFVVLGAWPVGAFFGLDVLGLYWAFRINFRAARAYEEVIVCPSDVLIRQVTAKGEKVEHHFNPFWARMLTHTAEDEGMVQVALTSHGKTLVLGKFLSPIEREDFAAALKQALADARENRVATGLVEA